MRAEGRVLSPYREAMTSLRGHERRRRMRAEGESTLVAIERR